MQYHSFINFIFFTVKKNNMLRKANEYSNQI